MFCLLARSMVIVASCDFWLPPFFFVFVRHTNGSVKTVAFVGRKVVSPPAFSRVTLLVSQDLRPSPRDFFAKCTCFLFLFSRTLLLVSGDLRHLSRDLLVRCSTFCYELLWFHETIVLVARFSCKLFVPSFLARIPSQFCENRPFSWGMVSFLVQFACSRSKVLFLWFSCFWKILEGFHPLAREGLYVVESYSDGILCLSPYVRHVA